MRQATRQPRPARLFPPATSPPRPAKRRRYSATPPSTQPTEPGQAAPPTSPVPASHVDTATGNTAAILGDTTFDIYLNDRAYWRNVPAAVWSYKLGGYQVLKKWLSYRESAVLKRPLKPEEVQHFTNTARRITAILLLATNR